MCEFGLCRANLGNSGSTSANFGQLRTIPSRSRPRLADLGRFGARSADAHAQMIHNPNLWPRARIESWPKLGEFATELAKIPRIRPNSGHTFPNPPDIGRIRARIGRTRPARSFSRGVHLCTKVLNFRFNDLPSLWVGRLIGEFASSGTRR